MSVPATKKLWQGLAISFAVAFTYATVLAKLIDAAIHASDPQQGLLLLSDAKSALAALDQSFAAAAGCCGPVPSELAKMRFASAIKRFRTALGAALGELPTPIEK